MARKWPCVNQAHAQFPGAIDFMNEMHLNFLILLRVKFSSQYYVVYKLCTRI